MLDSFKRKSVRYLDYPHPPPSLVDLSAPQCTVVISVCGRVDMSLRGWHKLACHV